MHDNACYAQALIGRPGRPIALPMRDNNAPSAHLPYQSCIVDRLMAPARDALSGLWAALNWKWLSGGSKCGS